MHAGHHIVMIHVKIVNSFIAKAEAFPSVSSFHVVEPNPFLRGCKHGIIIHADAPDFFLKSKSLHLAECTDTEA